MESSAFRPFRIYPRCSFFGAQMWTNTFRAIQGFLPFCLRFNRYNTLVIQTTPEQFLCGVFRSLSTSEGEAGCLGICSMFFSWVLLFICLSWLSDSDFRLIVWTPERRSDSGSKGFDRKVGTLVTWQLWTLFEMCIINFQHGKMFVLFVSLLLFYFHGSEVYWNLYVHNMFQIVSALYILAPCSPN